MDRPENLNQEPEVTSAELVAERTEEAVAEATTAQESATAPVAEGSRWYGISYQNQKGTYVPTSTEPQQPQKRKPRHALRIALIAALLACGILFCGTAGFVGSLLADQILPMFDTLPEADAGQDPSNGGSDAGSSYNNGSDADYNYGGVTLDKNDGTGLDGSIKGSAGDNAGTVMSATAAVKDSVVEIMVTTTTNYGTISAGAGSGVIIHADGVIVTNHHVIEDASTIRVRLTNGNTYTATLRGSDEDCDIAVIKIQPQETLTVAKMGYSGALALGEEVIAIGNPLGALGGTVTTGIISALEREINVGGVVMTLIQTNAAINAGNSGGGLFNLAGELIGIVNAKYAAEGVEGLGFAIPIDTAAVSIDHLLQLGYIPGVPALGATLIQEDALLGGTRVLMPYVSKTTEGCSLQVGDFVYSIGGESVVVNYYYASETPLDKAKRLIRNYKVGDTVTVGIYRGGEAQTVEVTLVEYIPDDVSVDFE